MTLIENNSSKAIQRIAFVLDQRLEEIEHRGIGDEGVQPAETAERALDGVGVVGMVADVANRSDHCIAKVALQRGSTVGVALQYPDPGAFIDKAFDQRPAKAGAAAGDQCHAVIQPSHFFVLLVVVLRLIFEIGAFEGAEPCCSFFKR